MWAKLFGVHTAAFCCRAQVIICKLIVVFFTNFAQYVTIDKTRLLAVYRCVCAMVRCLASGVVMTIGIFTAMQKEAASFIQNVSPEKIGAFTVYRFKLGKHDAVLCLPPSIGEIAAAAACQMLISRFGVQMMLNFGVVGGLTEQMSQQKAVYVGSVCHYDMDTSQVDNCPVGYYGCFDGINVPCDSDMLQKASSVLELPIVGCVSADKFVAEPQQKTQLYNQFGAEICDMESAAFAFTCKFNNVPYLSVKCIADTLFGGADEYEANSKLASQTFRNLAKRLCELADVD